MKRYLLTVLVMLLGLAPCLLDAQTLTRGPYLQMGGTTATTVRWRTSSATGSVVKYGTSASSLNLTASNTTAKTEHEIRLTGLSPNTKYFYSIGNATTTYASGSDCFFVTAPTSAKPTRIWVLGDSGTGDTNQANVRNAYYSFTGSRHTDLWLMLGDNAYQNGTDAEYQSTLFNVYGSMLRKSVMWSTIGNHDAFSADSPTESGPYYNIHTLPKAAEAGGVPSGTEAYYSFDYGNIHFVCLDSTDTSRSPTGAMAQWLISDLENNTKDWLIVFFHHPPYSKGSHDSDTKSNLIEMRRHFAPILEDYGVDIVLAGHSHSYERSRFIRAHYDKSDTFDSSYMVVQPGSGQGSGAYEKGATGPMPNAGAVYFTAGSSGKLSDGQFNHPAMWVSMKTLGSVVLDVDGQRLDAKFIDNTGAIRDSFTMLKGTGIPPPPPVPGDNGIIVDNRDTGSVTITGGWSTSKSTYGYLGADYHHDGGSGTGKTFKFTPNLPAAGSYEVFARWTSESNRASNARYIVAHAGGTTNVDRNQTTHNGMWRSLGVFNFNAGTSGSVTLGNTGANGVVVADAVSFVPQASQPPPSAWTSQDIGSVGVPGSMSVNGGTITVNGSGTTIGGTADSFHFAHQTRTGDFTITARVVSQTDTHSYARAGVMIRDGLGAGAKFADMVLTPSQGSYMQSRTTTGGTVASGSGGSVAVQYWVRVSRVGNDFKGYQSSNGTTWTQVSTTKVISMPATVNVGLAVCSFNNGTLGTATFEDVVISTP